MQGSPSPTGSLRSIGGGDNGAAEKKVEAVDDDGDGVVLRESDALMVGHRRKRRKGVRSGSLMAKLDYSERDTKCMGCESGGKLS